MPLINKKLLQETVTKRKHEVGTNTIEGLKELFQTTLDRIETGKFQSGRGLPVGKASLARFGKEESEKVPFLQKMFELLGYKLHQNLEFEFGINGRSIDAVLGNPEPNDSHLGRGKKCVEVAIEWKGINTKSLDAGKAGETPVSQMWDYMGKSGAEIGIVGNFLEFRIYTLKTKQSQYQEYFLRDLCQNEDKLYEFIFLLKKQTLLKNGDKDSLFEILIDQTELEQAQITKRFYADYKQRRLHLFEHLIEQNQNGDKFLLLEKAQKVLDRLIFILFCEDGFLLPSSILKTTYKSAQNNRSRSEIKVWEQIQYLFEDVDKGRYDINPQINAFNGGLFAEDLELNNLIIKDEIWKDLIQLADYDFASDLNVNILGHIFEQSVADIEEIKASLEYTPKVLQTLIPQSGVPKIDKTKSKRKKDGIYYTPEYITDYIVSETVGKWLAENNTPNIKDVDPLKGASALNQIKILDPAGGSGAFPNQVHSYLAKQHVQKANQIAINSGLETFANLDETQIDKSILKNNIFMVDLQPESVEIAKLSLWLKTARKDQKLNNLDENIKCGNSLIDDTEIAGNTAFDWHAKFPEVMANGGFDVIVGNPPYVRQELLGQDLKKHLTRKFPEVGNGTADLYVYFFAQAFRLLKEGGYLGFIAPNKWMERKYGYEMRKYLKDFEIVSIVNFGETKIFDDASTETAIFIIKKEKSNKPINYCLIKNLDEAQKISEYKFISCPKNELNDEVWHFANPEINQILEKIKQNTVSLEDYIKQGSITRGVLTGFNKAFIINKETRDQIILKDSKSAELLKPMLEGDDFNAWTLNNPKRYMIATGYDLDVPNLYPSIFEFLKQFQSELETRQDKGKNWYNLRACDYYEELDKPKLIYYHTAVHHNFYFDTEGYYLSANCYFIANADKYLQAILNSNFFQYIKGYLFPAFGIAENQGRVRLDANKMRKFPIPNATTEQQTQIADLVDKIMELKKTSQNLVNSFVKLITAKYKPATISTKLKKWYNLEIAEFLDELKKQKAVIGGLSAEAELMAYFESEKVKVLEVERQVESVDGEIERLVRGMYNLN